MSSKISAYLDTKVQIKLFNEEWKTYAGEFNQGFQKDFSYLAFHKFTFFKNYETEAVKFNPNKNLKYRFKWVFSTDSGEQKRIKSALAQAGITHFFTSTNEDNNTWNEIFVNENTYVKHLKSKILKSLPLHPPLYELKERILKTFPGDKTDLNKFDCPSNWLTRFLEIKPDCPKPDSNELILTLANEFNLLP